MPKSARSTLAVATSALATPIDYDALLAKLGAKDRLNIERHVAASEVEPGPAHVVVWKRMASALATLLLAATLVLLGAGQAALRVARRSA